MDTWPSDVTFFFCLIHVPSLTWRRQCLWCILQPATRRRCRWLHFQGAVNGVNECNQLDVWKQHEPSGPLWRAPPLWWSGGQRFYNVDTLREENTQMGHRYNSQWHFYTRTSGFTSSTAPQHRNNEERDATKRHTFTDANEITLIHHLLSLKHVHKARAAVTILKLLRGLCHIRDGSLIYYERL